jgi:lipid-binding SYLF domain-containing protein
MRQMLATLALGLAVAFATPAAAQDAADAKQVVERAKVALEEVLADKNLGNMDEQIKRARAVLIVPRFFKAGFVVGGAAGNGVLLARDGTGGWSYPAFYNMAAGSIGLQIGVQDIQIVLLIMNDGALQAMLRNRFKLGADASVAIGGVGAGIGGSTTTNLDADIITYGKGRGVFGGGAVEGAVLTAGTEWIKAYYGQELAPEAIVVGQQGRNPHANALRQVLDKNG